MSGKALALLALLVAASESSEPKRAPRLVTVLGWDSVDGRLRGIVQEFELPARYPWGDECPDGYARVIETKYYTVAGQEKPKYLGTSRGCIPADQVPA